MASRDPQLSALRALSWGSRLAACPSLLLAAQLEFSPDNRGEFRTAQGTPRVVQPVYPRLAGELADRRDEVSGAVVVMADGDHGLVLLEEPLLALQDQAEGPIRPIGREHPPGVLQTLRKGEKS